MAGTTSRSDNGNFRVRLADGVTWVQAFAQLNAAGVIVTPIQNANGQATAANSQPVVIASDQSRLNGSVASAGTGADGVANTSIAGLVDPNGQVRFPLTGLLFNGTSWDRPRNNGGLTILPSAARTTATDSADFTNYNWRGAIFVIDITAGTTPSLTFTVQGKDPVSGKYFTQLQSLALAAVGTTILYVYPGVTATNNLAATAPLSTTFRMDVAVGNANSITYSVGCIPVL